jgi:hypothetical protein
VYKYANGGAVAPDIDPAPVIPDVSTLEPEPLDEIMAEIDAMQSSEPGPAVDPVDSLDAPPVAKDWLKKNPKALYSREHIELCHELHNALCEAGVVPWSEDYIERLKNGIAAYDAPDRDFLPSEESSDIPEPEPDVERYRSENSTIRLSTKKPVIDDDDDDDDDLEENIQHNRRTMSAPVSREAPSLSSLRAPEPLKLTPLQREAAKISGISEAEYLRQLVRLKEEKSLGNHGGQP